MQPLQRNFKLDRVKRALVPMPTAFTSYFLPMDAESCVFDLAMNLRISGDTGLDLCASAMWKRARLTSRKQKDCGLEGAFSRSRHLLVPGIARFACLVGHNNRLLGRGVCFHTQFLVRRRCAWLSLKFLNATRSRPQQKTPEVTQAWLNVGKGRARRPSPPAAHFRHEIRGHGDSEQDRRQAHEAASRQGSDAALPLLGGKDPMTAGVGVSALQHQAKHRGPCR